MSLAVPSIIGNKNVLYPYPGGTVQWANLFNNMSRYIFDGGNDIAVDSEQNVYVAGFTGRILRTTIANNISGNTIYIEGTTTDLIAERPPFRYTGAILIKYTSDGNPQWCRFVDYSGNTNINNLSGEILFNNNREDIGVGLTVDPSNNIYMCGQHYGNNITFSTDTISTPFFIDISNINSDTRCTRNGFIAKYNSAGDFQWGHICAPISISSSPSIEYNTITAYNNNIYIGGKANRAVEQNRNALMYTLNNTNNLTKKENVNIGGGGFSLPCLFSINSNNGTYNWHRYIINDNTNGVDKINTVTVNNNYLYFGADFLVDMCGTTKITEKTVLFSGSGINTTSTGPNDIVVTYKSTTTRNSSILIGKYDLSGIPIAGAYIDSFNGTDYNKIDKIQKIIFDNSGNLLITGTSTGYNIDLSDLSYSRPDLTSSIITMDAAIFIAKYDSSLNPIKGRIIDTYRGNKGDAPFYMADIGNSIAVDSRNNIYIVGVLTDSSNNTQTVQIDNAIIDRYHPGGRSYGALLQLNSDLSAQWGIAIDTGSINYRYEEIRNIIIDKYDNIYVTGYGASYSANDSANATNNALIFGRGIDGTNVVKSMGTVNEFNYDICGFSASHGFIAKYSPGYVNIYPEQDGEEIRLSYYHTKSNKNLLKYNLIDTATSLVDASFSNKGFADISYIVSTQPANTKQYLIQLSNVKTNRREIVTSRPFTYNPIPAIQLASSVTMATTIQGASSLNGIAVDSKGYIYVCDVSQHCVRRFNPTFNDTSGVVVAGTAGIGCVSGSDLTKLLNPIQIVIDSSDNLYIMDSFYLSLNIRIIKWNILDNTKNVNILSGYYTNTSNKLESKCMYLTKNKEYLLIPYVIESNMPTYYPVYLIKYNIIDNIYDNIFILDGYSLFTTYYNQGNDYSYKKSNIKLLIINELPANNQYYMHLINENNDLIISWANTYLTHFTIDNLKYNNTIFNTNSIVQNPITDINYSIIIPNNNKLQTFVIRTQAVSDYFTLPSNNKFNSLATDPSNNIYAIYNNNTLLIKPESVQLWVDGQYNIEQQQIELQWGLVGSQLNSNIYYNVYKNNSLLQKNTKSIILNDLIYQSYKDISYNYKIETINKYNGLRISKNIIINISSVAPQFVFSPNPITLKSNSHIQYNDISFSLIAQPNTYIDDIGINNISIDSYNIIYDNNIIISPYLQQDTTYTLNINMYITVINNLNDKSSMTQINKVIILPKTGILSTPIIQSITPSYTSCRITLSGIDTKSLNDLSEIYFVDERYDLTTYFPIIDGANMYIDIVNLTEGTTYSNVYLQVCYKGDNIINTEPFSFTTTTSYIVPNIYNINTTYTLHDIVIRSDNEVFLTASNNEVGYLCSFVPNNTQTLFNLTLHLNNNDNTLRQPEYCCIDNSDNIYICSRFIGNSIGSTVTKYNNSNSTYFVIAGTSNNNTTPSGTGSSTFNQPLGVFVYNNFLFTCNKDMGSETKSAIFYKDISGITLNSNTIGTSIELGNNSSVGQGQNEGLRDICVDDSNIYYIDTSTNTIYYMPYTVNAYRTITFGTINTISHNIVISGYNYRNIIVDNNRNIYVTVTNNSSNSSKIIKLTNNNGSYTSSEVTIGVLGNVVTLSSQIRGISFNKTYTILYIVDSGNKRVVSIAV
jgi:hypothetical protein